MQLIRLGRDLRVDFFRGLALWSIFVDHIGADKLNHLTLHNFALCDATEVFVLTAGYAAGIVYGRAMDRQGWLYAAADAIRRSWTLYVAHIFLFVVFTAQVSYSAKALDRANYLDEIHLDVLGENPYRALFEALTLHFQPSYLNILPLYIALIMFFAMVMPLLRWPKIMLGLSVALYATSRTLDWNLPSWTGDGWYFNPLAWQLLFIFGAVLGYAPGLVGKGHKRVMDITAAIVLIFGLLEVWLVKDRPEITAHMPFALARELVSIDKTGLHPFRLASILMLCWGAARLIPRQANWLRSRWASPLVMCGQHSLPVFCAGVFLSFLGRLAFEQQDNWWMQAIVNVVGTALLIGVSAIAAWYKAKGRPQPVPAGQS